MSSGCIKGWFSMEVAGHDCRAITVVDRSPWIRYDNNELELNGIAYSDGLVSVKDPATFKLSPGASSVLEMPNRLKGQCVPDGVYTFRVESCGSTYEQHAFIGCQVRCTLDGLSIEALVADARRYGRGFSPTASELAEMERLYRAIGYAAQVGKATHAQTLLLQLKNKLKRYDCGCCP